MFSYKVIELLSINDSKTVTTAEDYMTLLPKFNYEYFCTKDLSSAGANKDAYKIMWVLRKMEIVKEVEKKGRTHFYTYKSI